MISAYSIQSVFNLDPFNSIYFAISRMRMDYIISRDSSFIKVVNQAEKKRAALKLEGFLKEIMRQA